MNNTERKIINGDDSNSKRRKLEVEKYPIFDECKYENYINGKVERIKN